jgi:circadian clock protein KaiB
MEASNSHLAATGGTHVRFHLFVAGETSRSRRAIENLERILEASSRAHCEVEVIDVLLSPERAEQERILTTPTLVREFPPPRRRVTGDLSDADKVLRVIGPLSEGSTARESRP